MFCMGCVDFCFDMRCLDGRCLQLIGTGGNGAEILLNSELFSIWHCITESVK